MPVEASPPILSDSQLSAIVTLALDAGSAIMTIYQKKSFEVFEKSDLSPVTEADLVAHQIIFDGLSKITPNIPIISEESDANRVGTSETYWLVDPLDGTRDFVARKDTFVVCIGLIHQQYPVAGVIHEPVTGKSWWARSGLGAFTDGQRIYNSSSRLSLIAAGSRTTPSKKMQDLYAEFSIQEVRHYGSALKFCHLSEGEVDLYPRFGLTSEWDTAAGQAIAEEAGCKVTSIASGLRLSYGKNNLLNEGGFIASRSNLQIAESLHQQISAGQIR